MRRIVGAASAIALTATASFAAGIADDCLRGDDDRRAVAACPAAIRADKRLPYTAFDQLYSALRTTGGTAAAIAEWSDKVRTAPQDAQALAVRGLALFAADELDKALADLTEAIRLDGPAPSGHALYTTRGFIHLARHDPDRALADFATSIRIADNAWAHAGGGEAFFAQGHVDQAIAELGAAVAKEPEDKPTEFARARYLLAKAILAKGDKGGFDSATEHLRKAVDSDACAAYGLLLACRTDEADLFYTLGTLQRAQGRIDDAIWNLERAVDLAPTDADARIELGRGHLTPRPDGQGRAISEPQAALFDFSEAIRLAPSNALAHTLRGATYHSLGDRERAIVDYSEAIRLDPKDARPYQARGSLYEAKRDTQRAVADYQHVLSLEADNDTVKSRLERLTGGR